MSDFTPTPEAVEAVARTMYGERKLSWGELGLGSLAAEYREQARAAIAAFVEAEGLEWERHKASTGMEAMPARQRLVGSWRKRD